MPSLTPYIPPKDADLAAWAANFSTLLTASPGTYGLTPTNASTVASAQAAWAAAYALVTSNSTKTPATVSAKNSAKVIMLATVRPLAQQISKNPAVSASDKTAIGVNPNTSVPSPITAPTTAPTLTVQSASSLGHIIRFRDSTASPSVKAKPYGVIQVQMYGLISATPVTDPTTMALVGTPTKSPCTITWTSASLGKTAYYAARWVTRTGLVGPWSPIINYVVAG